MSCVQTPVYAYNGLVRKTDAWIGVDDLLRSAVGDAFVLDLRPMITTQLVQEYADRVREQVHTSIIHRALEGRYHMFCES